MDKVFITHSRHDAPILEAIQELITIAGISPILYAYDINKTATAWEEIRDAIRNSNALFVVLSNNLSSSSHTQNWVGFEVGVACSFNKPVWIFEELRRPFSFPIPYLTDYLPYDLHDPSLRQLISAAASSYNMQPQQSAMIGLGGLGALLFGLPGLIGGAIIGALTQSPRQPPYLNLICYHPDCKTRFRSYVWLEQMECPACRRTLRFRTETLKDGQQAILPYPYAHELERGYYVWFDANFRLIPAPIPGWTQYDFTIASFGEVSLLKTLNLGQTVTGSFSIGGSGFDIRFCVIAPSGSKIIDKLSFGEKFSFQATASGTYQICLENKPPWVLSAPFSKPITLNVDIGGWQID